MASFDFSVLANPVSSTEPCGPDLDLAQDPVFLNYTARAEGLLPDRFFDNDGKAFDRTKIEFDAEFKALADLLRETRDLRLLVLLSKFLILNRDLPGFATAVDAMASLLSRHWGDVHPRPEDSDVGLRMAVLYGLDDTPHVILPLQFATLVESRRLGPISYRTYLLASEKVKPRTDETAHDLGTLQKFLNEEVDIPQLVGARDQVKSLQTALATIRASSLEQAGYDQAVSLDKLPPLVDDILGFLNEALEKRSPASAPAKSSQPVAGSGAPASAPVDVPRPASTIPPGSVASAADVAEALDSVATYFARSEPSSPALLLVRQAEQLMGKSFAEVMRILVPSHAEAAVILIGKDQSFELPVERLSTLEVEAEPPGEARAESSARSPLQALLGRRDRSAPPKEAKSRQDALALLEQVSAYYRVTEPSSPIPLFADRARELAEQDFLSLLRDVLPGAALRNATRDE
jgi:type VI secretion system protein ImpA